MIVTAYPRMSAMLCEAVQPADVARRSLQRAALRATLASIDRNLTVAELDTEFRSLWGERLVEQWEDAAPEPAYPVPEVAK